jgi:hypothetical protein
MAKEAHDYTVFLGDQRLTVHNVVNVSVTAQETEFTGSSYDTVARFSNRVLIGWLRNTPSLAPSSTEDLL